MQSHPSRVRGLKLIGGSMEALLYIVAPLAGAWIETSGGCQTTGTLIRVAPLAGAWIETGTTYKITGVSGRTPRGCVD